MNKKRIKIFLFIIVLIAGVWHFAGNTPRGRKAQIEKMLNKTYWVNEYYQDVTYKNNGEQVRPGVKYKYEYHFYKDEGKLYCNVKLHISDEDKEPLCWFYDMFKGEVEIEEKDTEKGIKGTLNLKNSISESDWYRSEIDSESLAYRYDAKEKSLKIYSVDEADVIQADEKMDDDSEFLEYDTFYYVSADDFARVLHDLPNSEKLCRKIKGVGEKTSPVKCKVSSYFDVDKGSEFCYFQADLSYATIRRHPENWEGFMKENYSALGEILYYPGIDIHLILRDEDGTAVLAYTKDGLSMDPSDID